MSEVNRERPYSSPLRERQAAATRQAVLTAARDLFISQGYNATTIDAIAERAGVSKPTVFSAVGNKQELLRTVRDIAFAGDDEPVPVRERPHVLQIQSEPSPVRAAELMAKHLTDVAGRYAELQEVLRAAAQTGDEDLRRLWESEEQQGLVGARFWVGVLATKGALRAGMTTAMAVDVMWMLMTPDNYHRLVHRRGWSPRKYRRWLADAIVSLLLDVRS